jgi:hypothetical protein
MIDSLWFQNPQLTRYFLEILTSCPIFCRKNSDSIPAVLQTVLSVVCYQLPAEYAGQKDLTEQALSTRKKACTALIRMCKALSSHLLVRRPEGGRGDTRGVKMVVC